MGLNLRLLGAQKHLALAFFANMAVRPVAERHHLKTTHQELAAEQHPTEPGP